MVEKTAVPAGKLRFGRGGIGPFVHFRSFARRIDMKTPFLADQLVSVVVLVLYFVVGFPCPSDARGVGPIVTTEYLRGG